MTFGEMFSSRSAQPVDLTAGSASALPTTRDELKRRATVRSQDLIEAVASLDAQPSEAAVAQIMQWIREEYESRRTGSLLGLFGRCYLGHPYVDHIMTTTGAICEHFTATDAVPGPYGAARSLAANPAYAFVEIYTDGAIIPIRIDGSPVV